MGISFIGEPGKKGEKGEKGEDRNCTATEGTGNLTITTVVPVS